MRISSAAILILALIVPFAAFAAPPSNGTLIISFDDRAISATGASPNAQVAFFFVAREPQISSMRLRTEHRIVTASAAGTARLDLRRALPPISVWAAVDLTTGQSGVALPDGSPFQRVTFPGRGLHRGTHGQLDRLRVPHAMIDVFWARAGVGSWRLFAGDGGKVDADGVSDGTITVETGAIRNLERGAPLKAGPRPGDFVLLVDAYALQFFSSEVTQ